ncbi:MAG: metal-sensitive transcriptional regulator [Bryobacteraceae bacterium]|nr:metal-sensitive transcriptional regulator [Bryobacteraceae bacterium]
MKKTTPVPNPKHKDDHARGCDVPTTDASDRKAVAVDPEIKAANVRRLRRIEGQVRGLQKMVEEDRYCPDIMVQLSAVHEALRTVGRGLLRNHLKHCTSHAVAHGTPEQTEAVYDELIELMYKHSR